METNLTEIIKKIRTAVLGREVKSSIADGLEYCGQISENAKADMDATAEAAKEAIDKTAEDAKNAIESNAASVKEQLSKDIDAKAAAALESIPEEYTELDGSVKQLKEDMSYVYTKEAYPELIKNNNLVSGGGYTAGTFSQNGNVFSAETSANISINFNAYGKKILVFWKLSKGAYSNLKFSNVSNTINATNVAYRKADKYEKVVLVAPESTPYICIPGHAGADTTVYLFDITNLDEDKIATITSDMAENDAVVFEGGEIVKVKEELPKKAELQAQNTRNLFSGWTNGYIESSGSFSANNEYYCADKISIEGQKTISVYGLTNLKSALHCACYDKNNAYLGMEINTIGSASPSFMLMTRPNTSYVRVYWLVAQTENIESVAIYIGASASVIGYIPHTKDVLPAKNIYYSHIPRYALKTGWTDKKIALFGDSLTENPKQVRYIDAVFGSNSEWHGIGGSRISGASSNAFWQDSRVESLPIDADCIIVAGGTNDRSSYNLGEISKDNVDTSTLCGAINVLLSKIFFKYMKVGYYDSIDYTGLTQVNSAKNVTVCFALPPYQGSDATDYVNTISNDIEKCLALWNITSIRQGALSGINAMNSRYYFRHAEDGSLTDATHGLDAFGERNARAIVKMLKDLEPLAEVDLVTN